MIATYKVLKAAALLAICLVLPARAAGGNLTDDVATLLAAQGLQGAVWSTLDAHGTVAVGAAGVSNANSGAKMRPDDRVRVGSVAKTLLAAGVLRLVSQGRLALDAPVSALLPGVVFDNRWEASDPVRVRHLLDHTSGLDDARLSQVLSLRSTPDTPLADGFAREGLLRIRSRPGAHCSYSNMGYTLLGRVIESVTGQRYERYLDAALLRPLGMHDSSFGFVSQRNDARLAMGHVEDGATQVAVPTYLRPAGQFTTTAADMGKLARFLMGDGRIDGTPFIAADLLNAMGVPAGTEAANAGLRIGYGLGLVTRDRHGATGKCHGGSTVGFRAMFCIFPQQRKGFFIALNADDERAEYGRFDALLVEALALGAAALPVAGVPFDSAAWDGFYIPKPNRFASFELLDTVLIFARLDSAGAGLRFAPFQSPAVDLAHVNGPLFRASDRAGASHVLVMASTGERVISTGTQSYRQVSLFKLVPLWISLLMGLLGLATILVCGLVRVATRRMSREDPLLAPFAGVVAILLALPLFFAQSLLALGDLTFASGALAAVTALLPLSMLVGMRAWRRSVPDFAAMLGVLQLTVVLAFWDLLPLRLWA